MEKKYVKEKVVFLLEGNDTGCSMSWQTDVMGSSCVQQWCADSRERVLGTMRARLSGCGDGGDRGEHGQAAVGWRVPSSGTA